MQRILRKIPGLAVAVLATLVGCGDLGEPTRATSGLEPGAAVFSSSTGRRYVVARDHAKTGSVSATIGSRGGELVLERHRLIVPAGAVSHPTRFAMGFADGDLVRLRFSASRHAHNDVGAAGFAVPLRLEVSYAGLSSGPPDENRLVVVYFRPDGLVDEIETAVEWGRKRVRAEIPHFSDFGLAWPF